MNNEKIVKKEIYKSIYKQHDQRNGILLHVYKGICMALLCIMRSLLFSSPYYDLKRKQSISCVHDKVSDGVRERLSLVVYISHNKVYQKVQLEKERTKRRKQK